MRLSKINNAPDHACVSLRASQKEKNVTVPLGTFLQVACATAGLWNYWELCRSGREPGAPKKSKFTTGRCFLGNPTILTLPKKNRHV
jgi:hypothetical protein